MDHRPDPPDGPAPFARSFTQQAPLPQAAIEAALAVLRTGRLHRYNPDHETPAAAALERTFAEWQGARYCLAVTSGGQAIQIALRALRLGPGAPVLTNAFTLAPVPGAIACAGGRPVLVEVTEDLVIDLSDLAAKADVTGARALVLSHMRGHLADMDGLISWADDAGVAVVEDCAHAMGATWAGRRAGSFGRLGCFSTQTYKHLNSGEGGLIVTDDADLAARATILSGSYMLYDRHGAGPDAAAFAEARLDVPNASARMDNLRAAILLSQMAELEANLARWEALYAALAGALADVHGLRLPAAPAAARRIGSSLQFRVPALGMAGCRDLVARTAALGVELKWFGAAEPAGFTSAHASWRFAGSHDLPRTDAVLGALFDLRLPLTFTPADARQIGAILSHCVAAVLAAHEGGPPR